MLPQGKQIFNIEMIFNMEKKKNQFGFINLTSRSEIKILVDGLEMIQMCNIQVDVCYLGLI